MVVGLVVVPAFATETTDTPDVVQGGNESTEGSGSEIPPPPTEEEKEPEEETQQPTSATPFQVGEQSYATLAEAVNAAQDGDTIVVTGNTTLTSSLYLTKSITLKGTGGNATISRSVESFAKASDSTRTDYNPAMIEVHNEAVLTLEDITLDDCKHAEGTHFIQEDTQNKGSSLTWEYNKQNYGPVTNGETVQDGILAIYNGDGSIVLGSGAVLANFGGMSAVRLSGGTLTMKAGSQITGGGDTSKNGKDSGTGAAGAVWMQGGELVMEEGSEIKDMSGRAVYVDRGKATINGTISNIAHNGKIWNAGGEVGIHIRNGAQVTLGKTGLIDGGYQQGAAGIQINNTDSKFIMDDGSCIKDFTCDAIRVSSGDLQMNGEITGIKVGTSGATAISMQNGATCTIGRTGNIHHNHVGRTTIYFQTSKLDLYGKIHHNYSNDKSGGVEVNNNTWGDFVMHPGAEITDNYSTEHGGGVMVCRGTFTMEGGLIARNMAGAQGGGVNIRRGGAFIMNGGEIKDNVSAKEGGGVAYDASETSYPDMYVNLNGGSISDNRMNAEFTVDKATQTHTVTDYTSIGAGNNFVIYGGTGTVNEYFQIAPTMNVDRNVYMTINKKTVTVTDGTKLGNANATKNTGSVALLTTEAAKRGFATPVATFWAQNDNSVAATVSGVELTEKPVYVLTQATDDKGAPATDAEFNLYPATVETGTVSFNLPDTGVNGCAMALVQPDNADGTLTITTDVKELTEGQDSYEILYNLSFEPTSAVEGMTSVTVEIISPLTGENKDTVTLTKNEQGTWTGTWTGTLAGTDFKAGGSIVTGAVATISAGAAETKLVYADGVSTLMKVREVVYHTVTFNSNGGSEVTSQTIEDGKTATHPIAPTRSGYTFTGWNLGDTAYDFTTPVTSDITLVAQWNYNGGGGGGGTGGGGGGGGGGSVDIPDDPTPLGGDLQLNREDHFAYVNGYADGSFQPGQTITRAEFTAIVTRFDEVTSGLTNPFSDTAGHWAEDVIAFAAEKKWVGGYPDGTFRPQNEITRAEAMTMVNNILERLVDQEGLLAEARQWPDNEKDSWYYFTVLEATNSHDYTRRSEGNLVENWTALK